MGYPVLESVWLAPNVRKLVVQAPHVTRNCGPGQFVIVRPTAFGERIPLTIGYADKAAGTITLFVQGIGKSTNDICATETGGSFCDVAGPMGRKTDIHNVGHAVIVGGGVGTAVIYPQARALKEKGNYVSAIIGGRSKQYVILEDLGVLLVAAVGEVEARHVEAVGDEPLEHLRLGGGGAQGGDDLGAAHGVSV